MDYLGAAVGALAAVLGLVGVMLSNSFKRQRRLQIDQQRMSAYKGLWAAMSPGAFDSPARFDIDARKGVAAAMTHWYYADGAGMFLTGGCRSMFLKVRSNLAADLSDPIEPPELESLLANDHPKEPIEDRRESLSKQQWSLLRSRMKADLGEFSTDHTATLREHDQVFLVACGQDPDTPPWRPPQPRPWKVWWNTNP